MQPFELRKSILKFHIVLVFLGYKDFIKLKNADIRFLMMIVSLCFCMGNRVFLYEKQTVSMVETIVK